MSIIKENQSKKSRIIHILILVIFIFIILSITGMIVLKYQVEGETNAPFDISKILVVSTAEGVESENPTAKWDLNVNQDNDLYITVEKKSKKTVAIKNVVINNINIIKTPEVGTINKYKPADVGLFKYDENYKIDDEIVYKGSKSGSINNLEISNQGGTIIIRFANENIGKYLSNENEVITHDGSLLKKIGVNPEQIKTKIEFDIIIETENNIKYKSTVTVDLPVGNIIEEGTVTQEINSEDIILKRI